MKHGAAEILTQVDRSQPGKPRHGIGSLVLPPVSQQDVEDVVLGPRPQGPFVHAAAHQLAVLNRDNCKGDTDNAFK